MADDALHCGWTAVHDEHGGCVGTTEALADHFAIQPLDPRGSPMTTVDPTPAEQLVQHHAEHRTPVADCQWCPLVPDPSRSPALGDGFVPQGVRDGRRKAAAAIRSHADGLRLYPDAFVAGMRRAAEIAEGDDDHGR